MRRLLIASVAILAITSAEARTAHLPLPFPPPHPAPVRPIAPTMGSVLKDVASNANAIVADLQAADSIAGATNPQTGKPFDALGHMCFPAAITLIQSLPNPTAFPAPSAGTAGLITGVEQAYLIAQAAQATINQFVTSGLPQSFKAACDPWIMDNMAQAANAAAAFTAFFAALVPK